MHVDARAICDLGSLNLRGWLSGFAVHRSLGLQRIKAYQSGGLIVLAPRWRGANRRWDRMEQVQRVVRLNALKQMDPDVVLLDSEGLFRPRRRKRPEPDRGLACRPQNQ